MKNNRQKWIAGLLCAFPLAMAAQQTEPLTGPQRLFEDGKVLFERHDYAAARQTLERYLQDKDRGVSHEEVDYMLACTAYELQLPDALRQLQMYLEAYPESRYRNRVQALIGSAYFFEGNYEAALRAYQQVNIDLLGDTERDECALRLGTSYLKMNDLDEAYIWFSVIRAASSKYAADARYNLAYIDYVKQRYDQAWEGFSAVKDQPEYAALAPYYLADIQLIHNNYRQALQLADAYLQAYPQQEFVPQMQRIAGETHYGLKDYAAAIPLLEAYHDAVDFPARNAMYRLGMSYFNTGVYSKAALRLGEAAGPQDAMSQNAYLHMGLSYLQLRDRSRARMAFEQAATTNFDPRAKEQALYNYALCIHETSYSPFAESVTVFERLLNEYPNSPYADRVNDYLVEVYMNTRSYQAALQSIAKISRPSRQILEAKQRILFRLGTESFAQADFREAIDYFSQSLQLGSYNQRTQADAYYWRGESKFRLEQYVPAEADMKLYLGVAPSRNTQEYALALYNLGYTSFKQKKYEEALKWFSRCVQSGSLIPEKSVVADAYNRMGDCHFYARRFAEAGTQYAQASSVDPSLGDYSLFQKGFVQGLQRNYREKIQSLNQLISTYPSSQYVDDALYEQGRAFVQLEDNANAIKRYSLLVERFPESPLSRKAANEIGLLYYQDDNYNQAIAAYKKVIQSYPGSEEAKLAQRDLKSIYVDLNKVDEYMAYTSNLPGGVQFDASERDSLTYVAAEKAYMRGDIEGAASSFTRYLQSFPQGAFSVNATYYLGLIAYNQKDYTKAGTYLDKVASYPGSKFAAEAMELSAEMAYNAKDYNKALGLYKRLTDQAATPEVRNQAATGALRSAYMAKNQAEIIGTASTLLAQSKLTPELANEAYYYRAKAFMESGKTAEALNDFIVLAKDTRTVYGAEAKYQVAQIYFDQGQTAKAEQEVLDYIEVSTPHAYWLARSFVLLSDVYVKMGRKLDAKQYLLSLQQNYQADDDIAQMIETRLAKLNSVK